MDVALTLLQLGRVEMARGNMEAAEERYTQLHSLLLQLALVPDQVRVALLRGLWGMSGAAFFVCV